MEDNPITNKSGRRAYYTEPTRRITMNLPKSVVDFVDQAAIGQGLSRSSMAAEMLEQLRLEVLASELKMKPIQR